jgi:hypothetical protein
VRLGIGAGFRGGFDRRVARDDRPKSNHPAIDRFWWPLILGEKVSYVYVTANSAAGRPAIAHNGTAQECFPGPFVYEESRTFLSKKYFASMPQARTQCSPSQGR